jgi:hypothetical protein
MWSHAVRTKEAAAQLSMQILLFKPLEYKKILDAVKHKRRADWRFGIQKQQTCVDVH